MRDLRSTHPRISLRPTRPRRRELIVNACRRFLVAGGDYSSDPATFPRLLLRKKMVHLKFHGCDLQCNRSSFVFSSRRVPPPSRGGGDITHGVLHTTPDTPRPVGPPIFTID